MLKTPLIKESKEKTEKKPEFDFDIKQSGYLLFRRNYFYDEETYKNKKLMKKLDNRNPESRPPQRSCSARRYRCSN